MRRFFLIAIAIVGACFSARSETWAGQAHPTHTITTEASLLEVSIRLYGTSRHWRRIARLSKLRQPYAIWPGRVLRLPKAATLALSEGDRAVLKMWRRRLELRSKANEPPTRSEPAFLAHLEEARKETLESLDTGQAEARQLFEEGERLFKAKSYEAALDKLRRSRGLNSEPLPTWFYEFRALRMLEREEEAKGLARELLQRRPDLKSLPMFQPMLKDGG